MTQINQLPTLFQNIGASFGPAMGGGADGSAVAITSVSYFSIVGFIVGYLWTRIYLGREFAIADSFSINAVVEAVAVQREEHAQVDARAISMAYQWLSTPTEVKFTADDLKAAIKAASAPVKVQIFYHAETIRQHNWQKAEDKPRMELTIPIFEALVESDPDGRFHRNYGQLGYALKDKKNPEYRRAEQMLERAIAIRGPSNTSGTAYYEFNRAVCRIQLDEQFLAKQPSSEAMQRTIWSDLEVARKTHPKLFRTERLDASVAAWMKLNPLANPPPQDENG